MLIIFIFDLELEVVDFSSLMLNCNGTNTDTISLLNHLTC